MKPSESLSEPARVVFDVMRFSVRDGPGIRTTVFFKGCPLDCWWCHNPESRSPTREPVFWPNRCIRCGACTEACPTGAVAGEGACLICGACVEACPAGAREIIGRPMTVSELLCEILKDRVFFEESGGGVTFSGGEPLMEPEYLARVLDRCRLERIHTAVDTCGHVSPEAMRGIRPKVDLFLYDIKLMDPERHRVFTGVSNGIILENLRELAASGSRVIIRFPVIPGVNDDEGNIVQMGRLLADLRLGEVHLLPYHGSAHEKYRRLKVPYRMGDVRPPGEEALALVGRRFEAFGLTVRVGG